MTPYIAVGLPYISIKGYIRYKASLPKMDMAEVDMIVNRIIMLISLELSVPKSDILSNSRRMPEKDARHLAIRIIRNRTKLSTVKIGQIFNRDHATIVHSLQTTDGWIRHNHKFNQLYTSIDKLI